MLSINRLSARQLLIRKGRTILTGLAIMLGVASIFSLLMIGTSGVVINERQARANFGFADLQVVTEPSASQGQVEKDITALGGVEGVAVEKRWMQVGSLNGEKIEFHIKGIEPRGGIASKLYPLSDGRLPQGDQEMALSLAFARDKGYHIGQDFTLPLKSGARKLKIVGLIKDGPSVTSVTTGIYIDMLLLNKLGSRVLAEGPGTIEVVLNKGETQKDMIPKVEDIGGVAHVTSSDEVVAGTRKSSATLKDLLMAVGAIALAVGVTLVYTSFGITAAEREREIGLFKAIGANRRWTRRIIYREAVILGIVFSAVGLLLGLALGYIFMWVMLQTGMNTGVDVSDLVVSPQDAIVSFLAGFGATVFSALLPARKIGRTHPLAAIRPQPKSEHRVSKIRWVGLPIIAIGVVMLYKFATASDPEAVAPIGFGAALATYLGVVMFMPVIVGPLFSLLEWISLRRVGAAGKLAAKNLGRHSMRSSRTVTAILVSASLIFLVAFFTNGAVSSGHEILKEQLRYDLAITGSDDDPLPFVPKELINKVKKLEGVDLVTSVRLDTVKVVKLDSKGREISLERHSNNGVAKVLSSSTINALDPDIYPQLSNLFFNKSVDNKQIWKKLHGKYILVQGPWAKAIGLKSGDKVKLTGKGGRSTEFEVLATYATFLVGSNRMGGGFVVSQENAEKYLDINKDADTLIKLKAGAGKTEVTTRIKQLIKGTSLEVKTDKQISEMVDKLMAGPQSIMYALFGIVVFVSLLGVVNMIAIGVLERRHEIGLVKAVGGTSKQIRLSIAMETVLVSFVGAILGIVLSTGVAAFFFKAIYDNDTLPHAFTFPTGATVFLLTAVILVSLMGALIPMHMANRVTPVEAIRFE